MYIMYTVYHRVLHLLKVVRCLPIRLFSREKIVFDVSCSRGRKHHKSPYHVLTIQVFLQFEHT